MKYAEDFSVGSEVDCGSFCLTREEIIDFAGRYDPQPFHLDEAAATQSLFGKLTASGVQSACCTRQLSLQSVYNGTSFLGSTGFPRMQMHQPVFAAMAVQVTHTIRDIRWLPRWPGVALITGIAVGRDARGEAIITLEDLAWVAGRHLAPGFDLAILANEEEASPSLGPFIAWPQTDAPVSSADSPLYWQDCLVGMTIYSRELVVAAEELARFHREFDPAPAADGRRLSHDWSGAALAMRVMFEDLWRRLQNTGGTGLDMIRQPYRVAAGDRLRGAVTILAARPLRSRPQLGLVHLRGVCINQRDEVVASYLTNSFVRQRAEETP